MPSLRFQQFIRACCLLLSILVVSVTTVEILREPERPVHVHSGGAAQTNGHVLILSEGSRFKNSVSQSLLTNLAIQGMQVDIIPIAELGALPQDALENQYNLVVAIVSLSTWNVPPVLRPWLTNAALYQKAIFAITTKAGRTVQLKRDLYGYHEKLDAFTLASSMEPDSLQKQTLRLTKKVGKALSNLSAL